LSLKSGATRRITLPLQDKEPKLTTQDAAGLGIKGLVMSFTTRHNCCEPRVQNIHHAAAELDGQVLRPGERFSLNEFLGPRTEASGYHKAPTIVRGEMEDVYGGGISQLATTLFNAVLRGGYEIVQRQPHSVYFTRYPEGHEATVSYPEPDLIFRNDTAAGMVIKTNAAPTFISVLVFGDNGGRSTTVDKGRRYKIVDPPKEYEADEEMVPEKAKRLRAGQLGWTVLVSRKVKYPDGTEKVEKREVVYNPRPELLRVHPCMIPEGDEGHTGEECPEVEIEEEEEELSEDAYFETR
jgi:vancomycin resistance protein YoaR